MARTITRYFAFQADNWSTLVRRINVSSGEVTTLAGATNTIAYRDGVGTAAAFSGLMGIAMDAAGTTAIVVS